MSKHHFTVFQLLLLQDKEHITVAMRSPLSTTNFNPLNSSIITATPLLNNHHNNEKTTTTIMNSSQFPFSPRNILNNALLFLTCIFLLSVHIVQCDSSILIPQDVLFYDKLSYTPTFGTFKLMAQYTVDPSNYMKNVSFSLKYLDDSSYASFQNDATPFLTGSRSFTGEFDIFNYNLHTFNNNLVFNYGSLLILEMRFPLNTNTKRYHYILVKNGGNSPPQYRLFFTKFDLIEVPRLYDRSLAGAQTVSIPPGMTEKFICDVCSSTYIDVNDLDAKASFIVSVLPVVSGYTIHISVRLSNIFDSIYGWSSDRSFVLKDNKITLSYESNTNSITDLYIQVTAINCTFNGQPVTDLCPFSFNVKPNNKKNLSSGGADTAIVVTAIILSMIILLAIVLSSGYFYYRYRMSKRYEESRLQNLREIQSRAQMALPNGLNVQSIDESQRPHDPFVRLDKLHGYSLDSSTHFIMDAALPKVSLNLTTTATTPTTPEPVVQYGVDTKRLSQQRVDVPPSVVAGSLEMDSTKLEMKNEQDHHNKQ